MGECHILCVMERSGLQTAMKANKYVPFLWEGGYRRRMSIFVCQAMASWKETVLQKRVKPKNTSVSLTHAHTLSLSHILTINKAGSEFRSN